MEASRRGADEIDKASGESASAQRRDVAGEKMRETTLTTRPMWPDLQGKAKPQRLQKCKSSSPDIKLFCCRKGNDSPEMPDWRRRAGSDDMFSARLISIIVLAD